MQQWFINLVILILIPNVWKEGLYHFKKFNFWNQNKLEWFSVPDSWEPHPDTCATHPPLKYPVPLLEEKMRWNGFETNLAMLGNKICRQLLGMQWKYHWWERLAREWEWEIDFSLQETNSSWQPYSEKQVGVHSIAPSQGSTWPHSAPDQPLTHDTEGSRKYFWNGSKSDPHFTR